MSKDPEWLATARRKGLEISETGIKAGALAHEILESTKRFKPVGTSSIAQAFSEANFLRMVLSLAKLRGWRTAHFRPGMSRKGKWMTAVAGDGKGFPDLILARRNRIISVELKVGRNQTTPEQIAWLEALTAAGVPCFVWLPQDWTLIEDVLL